MNDGFKVLNWLLTNGNAQHEPERWAALLGIDIIDWDGWRNHDHRAECDLMTFVTRVARCTINPHK